MSAPIDLDAYFARVGYDGPRDASLSTLRSLTALHPKAIPFENLDTLAGKVPSLDLGALQAKMVGGGRGGYCFEHNGLFEAVLAALGFEPQPLAGRVEWGMPPEALRPRTHKLLKLETGEGPLLVDVGFGGLVLTAPLALVAEAEQDTGHGVFRLRKVGPDWQLQALTREGYMPKYRFSEEVQQPSDYEMANWFVATHAASPFPTNLICARVMEDRRLGLWNRELSIRWRDGRVEKKTLSGDDLLRALVSDFGLPDAAVLSAEPALARLPV